MKKVIQTIAAAIVLAVALLASGCSPSETKIEGVFFTDIGQAGNTFSFFKFFPDGSVSYVAIGLDEGIIETPSHVYESVADEWLIENPPAPAQVGRYTLNDGKIEIFFPASSTTPKQSGTYTPNLITLTDENGNILEYLPLP